MDIAEINTVVENAASGDLKVVEWKHGSSILEEAKPEEEITKLVIGPESAISSVQEALESDKTISRLFPGWYAFANGRRRIDTNEISRWLLTKKIEENLESALAALAHVTAENAATETLVTVWHGVTLENSLDLDEGVQIAPLSGLPDSQNKNSVIGYLRPQVFPYFSNLRSEEDLVRGFCAITWSRSVNPLVTAGEIPKYGQDPSDEFYLNREVGLALSLVEGLAPIEVASWSQFADDPPIPNLFGTGTGHSLPQHLADMNVSSLKNEVAARSLNQYLALESETRQRLQIPLRRLNRATRRRGLEDAAIDLGIALEALLTEDSSTGENTHKIAIRGARLLGGSDDARKQNRNLLRSIYRLRSNAVHNGKISEKNVDAPALLDAGRAISRALLRKVVDNGGHPNWSDFDVSEN